MLRKRYTGTRLNVGRETSKRQDSGDKKRKVKNLRRYNLANVRGTVVPTLTVDVYVSIICMPNRQVSTSA